MEGRRVPQSMARVVVISALLLLLTTDGCSRVEIRDNGYTGIVVALPRSLGEEQRTRLVLNVEAMIRSASGRLQLSTKGRARFAEVTILLPEGAFPEGGAALSADTADVVVSEAGRRPYVLHHDGCGRSAKRIILPERFLLGEEHKAAVFHRLWSEYRYGAFPEGGFRNDERYPVTYGGEEAPTGCSDDTFCIPNLCRKQDEECAENSTSSLMDQHQPYSAQLFCEGSVGLGPRHDSHPPSKQNLLCREEGTWFTVMRNQDFSQGRNAAPRRQQDPSEVSFRFVRESTAPKVVVAVETSSRMSREFRFRLIKSPLYRFLFSTLPDGSEVTLILFGGDEGVKVERYGVVLQDHSTKLHFLESQPLPEDVSETDNLDLEQLFEVLFQAIGSRNDSRAASADIVVVTTIESFANASIVRRNLAESESRLNVLMFEGESSRAGLYDSMTLYDLCIETGGHFTSLRSDATGDMHRGFGSVIREQVLILQDYLKKDADVDLEVPFVLDQSLGGNLKVHLSFPVADTSALQYKKTTLRMPSGGHLNFLKMEIFNAWVIDLAKPEAGEYVLKTRRIPEDLSPVLVSVSGSSSESEDPITVNVWTETVPDSAASPAPVKIFVEVREGWNPVSGAQVVATIRHPDDLTSHQTLLDDGLGDIDITKEDGIYGSYFTNFTTPGYYNVYVQVTRGPNGTHVLTGPDHFCCGSFFPASQARPIGSFQRETGPSTFRVPWFEASSSASAYPPSRVTDLRLAEMIDRICIVLWTAVGDDYNTGLASRYELKVFRDSEVIRNRFSDSGQEVYSETIEVEAAYGASLNHMFRLPDSIQRGMYYVAVRAIDSAGNEGEPSNAVPVWIEDSSTRVKDCENREMCENDECVDVPIAERLQSNAAISGHMLFGFISVNVFVFIMAVSTEYFVRL